MRNKLPNENYPQRSCSPGNQPAADSSIDDSFRFFTIFCVVLFQSYFVVFVNAWAGMHQAVTTLFER